MTWKDKLELGLKDDAAFRKDNLPADEVHGPEEAAGPGRSPVVTDAREGHHQAGEGPTADDKKSDAKDATDAQSSQMENEGQGQRHRGAKSRSE